MPRNRELTISRVRVSEVNYEQSTKEALNKTTAPT